MIVVSDTSAITSLIQIGREELLARLFARVLLPTAVSDELLMFHAALPSFLEVAQVQDQRLVRDLCIQIDSGEAEAIVLAHEKAADVLLMDDLAARRIAVSRGLPVIGLSGVLVQARRKEMFRNLNEIIQELESTAGFRLAPSLKEAALRAVGE